MAKTNHKWIDDVCIHCNLERKGQALSKNLRNYGTYLYTYKVDNVWTRIRPNCMKK